MAKEVVIGSKYDIYKVAIEYLVRDFIDVYNSKKSVNPRTCPECMKHIETGISIDNLVFHKHCILEICYEKKLLKRPNQISETYLLNPPSLTRQHANFPFHQQSDI